MKFLKMYYLQHCYQKYFGICRNIYNIKDTYPFLSFNHYKTQRFFPFVHLLHQIGIRHIKSRVWSSWWNILVDVLSSIGLLKYHSCGENVEQNVIKFNSSKSINAHGILSRVIIGIELDGQKDKETFGLISEMCFSCQVTLLQIHDNILRQN